MDQAEEKAREEAEQKASEERAREVLEIDEVRDIYNKLVVPARLKGPLMLVSLLHQFGSSPEFKIMKKEYDEAFNQIGQKWKGLEHEKGFSQAITTRATEELNKVFNKALELARAGKQVIEWPEGLRTEEARQYLAIANSQLYINFRDRVAKGGYSMEPGTWPEVDISGGRVNGKAVVKPDNVSPVASEAVLTELQEAMREKVLDLAKQGDLAADVFDIITAKWLKEAKHHEATIIITADEFLQARGLKKMLSGSSGRRGGYKDEWRREIAEQIDNLSHQWITVAEMEVVQVVKGKRKLVKWRGEGRALNMDMRAGQEKLDGSIDPYVWRIRPGSIFSEHLYGPGRQTALLSNRALQYDYYRQKWEKRLSRYLAYIWRIDEGRTMEGLLVKTLLDKAGEEINKRFPGRTRDRLEKALDQLQKDGIITAWQYENINENKMKGRQWWKKWIELKIILTAPAEVLEHYKQIERPKKVKR